MSLEDLGNIGEFVAAVAVVVSLIYLAVQIRQNTRSVRASTHHSAHRSAREAEMAIAGSETLAHIFRKGAREPERLTGDERVRFDATMRTFFGWYEDIFFQYRQAMVNRDFWETRRRSMLDHLQQPGVSSWWGKNSRLYTDSFVSEVGRLQRQAGAAAQQAAAPSRDQDTDE
jgi:hypothetical protein